jgi:hypothetical protein
MNYKREGGMKKKYTEKEGITPILDMIQNGNVTLISNSSLYSVVLNINVDEENSQYLDKDFTGKFVIPVTDCVLKLVIGNANKYETDLNYLLMGEKKSTEIIGNIKKEADTQQTVWMKSSLGGRSPICPPIADVIIIDKNKSDERWFLNLLKSRSSERRFSKILDSLFSVMRKLRSEGNHIYLTAIVMPLRTRESKPSTFYDIFSSRTLVPHFVDYVSDLLAKIIRLFQECSIVHMDLHNNNALACIDYYGLPYASIIDFGRSSDFSNNTDDDYFYDYAKNRINNKKNEFINELKNINIDADVNVKIAYITEVYEYIKTISNTRVFKQKLTPEIKVKAFDILKRSTSYNPEYLSKEELDRFIEEGTVYNPKSTLKSKLITESFMETHTPPEDTGCSGIGCSIMGGKRRKRRKTRNYKNKKNRHTRRNN